MSVFSTERPISVDETKAMLEQKAVEYKANRQLMEAQRLLEEQEAKMQAEMEQQDAAQKEKEKLEQAMETANQKRQMELANRAYGKAVASLPKIGRETLVKNVLFKIATESMWVDESVKASPDFLPQTFELFEQVISRCDEATGTTLLANMESTRLLSYINDVATEGANVVCDRILAEAAEAKPLTIDFTPNAEEIEEIDKKIADANPGTISNAVKKKVLDVIKEEKEEGKLKAELFQELDDASAEEEEGSDNVVESLIGIPMDQVMEAINIKSEDTSVFEHVIHKANTLMSLADRECVARNNQKAITCYEQAVQLIGQAESILRYQDQKSVSEVVNDITKALNHRMFMIRPGTGKAIRCETVSPVHPPRFDMAGKILKTYCKNMSKAMSCDNVVTETLEQTRNRIARNHASQVLRSTIGSTMFESLMIKNAVNVKNAVTESGTSMLESEVQNAALLQTIVEYTLFETLNTMQVYNFNRDAMSKLKQA